MAAFISVIGMSAFLGVGSFVVGSLPLTFTFSKITLAKLSIVGSGLLLGTALGVIIPEGAETVAHADKDFPTQTVAFSLLGGFMFMLLVEQFITGHSHSHSHHEHLSVPSETPQIRTQKSSAVGGTAGDVVFDVELGDLEQSEGIGPEFVPMPGSSTSQLNQFSDVSEKNEEDRKRAYPLTLGLVIHALADGLALGSAAIANGSAIPSGLSLVVFLALIVHKAPTALALATSLLSTGLPRPDCRKHIAIFSASTPIGALVSFGVLSIIGITQNSNWAGIALLVSGGTFLYVATALQPQRGPSEAITERAKLLLLSLGMLTPVGLAAIFGDVH